MFRTVVWATDGSASADRALGVAKELAQTDGGSLIAVHSKERFVGGRAAGYPVYADEDELEAKIKAQVEDARKDGVDA